MILARLTIHELHEAEEEIRGKHELITGVEASTRLTRAVQAVRTVGAGRIEGACGSLSTFPPVSSNTWPHISFRLQLIYSETVHALAIEAHKTLSQYLRDEVVEPFSKGSQANESGANSIQLCSN
jgi:hypothetical protein